MDIENDIPEITIGYYPFRGKAQICRLLCEYLRIPFQDKQFTPDQWNQYKENTNNKWIIKDLPFLQHGDFIVTGTGAIIHYIIEYACRTDLVGKTIDDKLKMDTIRSHCNLN
jgi:glutathione S-transferase